MEVHREYAHEVPKADPVLRDLNKSNSELTHLEQAHRAGYNNPHSLPVILFNSFKSSGWISWPSPLAFPVSLRICDGVLEPGVNPGAAVQQQQEAGLGGHQMREAGVVCLLAVQKRQQWTCPEPTRVWSG